jgi:phage terminase small subunit
MRMEGQIVGKESEILAPDGKTTPTPGQQVIKDTAISSILRSGIRPSDFNLANLLQRGLPSVGLPGGISNFTNSLSAGAASAGGLLNQVAGAAGQATQLASQLGVSPIGGVNALTSGLRLSAAGLSSLSSIPNLAAAGVTAAGSAIGNIANIPNAAVKLASNTVNSIASLPSTLASAAQTNPLVQNVTGLATQAFSQVSGLVGNAKNAVVGLQNPIPTDFASVGSKLGIDPSALAGLSPELASKMTTELSQVAKEIPPNTDLGGLKEQGISFANINRDKLSNLPALQPKVSAPAPLTDPASAEAIASKFGSLNPLLGGTANLSPLDRKSVV